MGPDSARFCGLFLERRAKETDEMRPEWIDTSKMPYSKMWEADRHWMPHVIEGKYVKARFTYSAKQRLVQKK